MRTVRGGLALGALVGCGPEPLVLPPAPALPIEVLEQFDDSWVVDTTPVPGPVWSHAEAFATPGDLALAWERVGLRGERPTVAQVPEDGGQVGVLFGSTTDRPTTLAAVRRSFPVPASGRVTASVRVWEGGMQGEVHTAPPILRVQAVEVDPKTDRTRGLGQATEVAAWRPDGASGGWQTLSVVLDIPRGTDRVVVELSPGLGRATGWVAFSDLLVEAPSAAALALTKTPASKALRSTPHPRVRSIRTGPDQRPALVSPTAETWVVPLPERTEPVVFTTHVAVPKAAGLGKQRTCWSIETIPASAGPSAKGCEASGSRWAPVRMDLSPEVDGLRFEVAPEDDGDTVAPVAWARPRVSAPSDRSADPRPDLVLVVVDTLRADGPGHAGAPHAASPALDQLATSMDRYTRAFAASSWTLPSLASVVTGRWPAAHGAGFRARLLASAARKGSVEWKARTFAPIAAHTPTLAEQLSAAGYCTEAFVTNFFFGASFGFQRGFDRFTQYAGNSVVGAEHLEDLLADRDACEGPRFTVLHLFEPHMPLRYRSDAPEGFVVDGALDDFTLKDEHAKDGRSARALHTLDRVAKADPDTVRALYDTETWHADRLLGRVLADIAPPGTGLIFLSDHGEHFGEHDRWGHGTSMFDELIRVPLLVRAPDRSGPGAVVDDTVSLVDITPTMLSWAGLHTQGFDGHPLGTAPADRTVWAEYIYKGPETLTGIRGDSMLVRTLGRGTRDGHASGRGPKWTATDSWFTLADPWATPSPPQEADELLRQATDRLRTTYPGLHVTCSRTDQPRETEWFTTTGTLVQVTPLQAIAGDGVETARNGRRAVVTLASGDGPFEAVVETVPPGAVRVGPHCTVERVGARGEATALDDETVEALEAIGYMGD